jgi:hypothetical protein
VSSIGYRRKGGAYYDERAARSINRTVPLEELEAERQQALIAKAFQLHI